MSGGGLSRLLSAHLLAVGGHDAQVTCFDALAPGLLRGRQQAFNELDKHCGLHCIEVAGRFPLTHLQCQGRTSVQTLMQLSPMFRRATSLQHQRCQRQYMYSCTFPPPVSASDKSFCCAVASTLLRPVV